MAASVLENITVTTDEKILFVSPVDNVLKKSLFIINTGDQPVRIIVYGSPTGITVADFTSIKTGIAHYTQTEVDLHYRLLYNIVVANSSNAYINLSDDIYNYFKVTAQSLSGTSTINYSFQKISFGVM